MTARNSDGTATSSSRRESLATLAGASVLALSTPALAASKAAAPAAKPGAIGVSEADGFTAVLVSHGTRSFELYQDLINEEYFVLDQKSGKRTINAKVFDKYIGVIRNVIGRSVDAKGKEVFRRAGEARPDQRTMHSGVQERGRKRRAGVIPAGDGGQVGGAVNCEPISTCPIVTHHRFPSRAATMYSSIAFRKL